MSRLCAGLTVFWGRKRAWRQQAGRRLSPPRRHSNRSGGAETTLRPSKCFNCSRLDHYPPVSYALPDASDTQINLVKTLFLGKV
ncbi:hypothetical protein Z043_109045 [Scleropages formosus]|uniref:Uncharacterized protein n=1 Tax=Scleropages formosus TaxID=113540 RepID=A0A0P7VF79_SCLFO|nr:hypothetical protein Z043_109045 [Scleropages formosus]